MGSLDLESAYLTLGIDDGASLADEDVGVAFYKRCNMEFFRQGTAKDALEIIAEKRESRFLRFLASIGGSLDEKNVAVLAKKTFNALPEPEEDNELSLGAGPVDGKPPGENSHLKFASESSESEMEKDAYGEYDATGEDSPSQPRSPSSREASISSDSEMSVDSDFSQEFGDIFFDRHVWRCEDCCMELVDWKCPNGHELRCCKTCGWQLEEGACQRCLGTCGACGGKGLDSHCSKCGEGEGSEYEDTIAFDEMDGLWRCIECQWEVEADNETEGNCHCLNDKLEAHFIDLSDCLDYEPADSCSSESDSTDSEPNSDDEAFIDDTEFPTDGTHPDVAIANVNLAALYPAYEFAVTVKEAAEMTKGAEMAETVNTSDGPSDIKIIDGLTANGPSTLPSNIIDCESMDI